MNGLSDDDPLQSFSLCELHAQVCFHLCWYVLADYAYRVAAADSTASQEPGGGGNAGTL